MMAQVELSAVLEEFKKFVQMSAKRKLTDRTLVVLKYSISEL